ncbi:SCO family protein [Rhizobacter sp. Root1221]|uniref:SCO family protein n=1 Tax=Rhizobacter sp. Root1221 TaxID=1736433 RepID=UPI0007023B9B|nr:SCO family protein [Rhizobacter sp. Root1221]KQV94486.1 photosynthetic protein synthase I [Rhizobacter sp. Root1221]
MTFPRRSLLALGLASLLAVSACDKLLPGKQVAYNAVDITGAGYGRTLSLPDAEGRTRSLADFNGKYVVVFFGYTQCPDVCPGTLAELAQVKKALGPDGDKVQGVFITVDPERDTPQVLKGYVTSFDPGFVALRGTPEQTAAIAKDFKVYYAKVPGKSEGSYSMDHTAGSYVFDTKGQVRLFTRYGGGAEALTSDLKQLIKAG